MLAILAGHFRDLDLADDAVQEALAEAARTWPTRGIPANPAAWLLSVARRRAIDRLRRGASADRRLRDAVRAGAAPGTTGFDADDAVSGLIADHGTVADDRLRLILLCCHPALDRDTQVALTLRLVSGLSTAEIAAAFLVPEPTLAQRIVRAKRKIREAGIPLTIPAALDERLAVVMGVVYLVFNEGYLSRGGRADLVRVDLVEEAVRLTRLLVHLVPGNAELEGLLALELYHSARLATRTDATGELVQLEHQDRTRWDLPMIEEANAVLSRALSRMTPGVRQVEAAIAGHHASARTAADTDWPAIVGCYDHLLAMTGSPVVALNRAVAVAMADGPLAGLSAVDALEALGGLDGYHLFHVTRAELLARSGRRADAEVAFQRAIGCCTNPAELRHLRRRLGEVRADA